MSKVIVTGACGFIGTNLSKRLLDRGDEVIAVDNLSRRGTEFNLAELEGRPGFHYFNIDLRDAQAVDEIVAATDSLDAMYHLAAQVAVTLSYQDIRQDFEQNAVASFNIIDSIRRHSPGTWCFYASTNKVYGDVLFNQPVGLANPLAPYTPYGVSKAVGELYFSEFGRPEIGLNTCSFRQSCIYGEHQFGVEDQGWLAWFTVANLLGMPLRIYGDGLQIRDLLHVDDLVDLYLQAWETQLTGVYPVGGGQNNTMNLMDAIALIELVTGKPFQTVTTQDTRPGDQKYFVAGLDWLEQAPLDWQPRIDVRWGLTRMVHWMKEHESDLLSLQRLPLSA